MKKTKIGKKKPVRNKKFTYKHLLRILDSLGLLAVFGSGNTYMPSNKLHSAHKAKLEISIGLWRIFEDPEYTKELIVSSVAHEIGHYLVTPPQRRRRKDFGIPNNYLDDRSKYDIEELKAQFIQQEILNCFSFKRNVIDKRNWAYDDAKKWWGIEGKSLMKNLFYIAGV